MCPKLWEKQEQCDPGRELGWGNERKKSPRIIVKKVFLECPSLSFIQEQFLQVLQYNMSPWFIHWYWRRRMITWTMVTSSFALTTSNTIVDWSLNGYMEEWPQGAWKVVLKLFNYVMPQIKPLPTFTVSNGWPTKTPAAPGDKDKDKYIKNDEYLIISKEAFVVSLVCKLFFFFPQTSL